MEFESGSAAPPCISSGQLVIISDRHSSSASDQRRVKNLPELTVVQVGGRDGPGTQEIGRRIGHSFATYAVAAGVRENLIKERPKPKDVEPVVRLGRLLQWTPA